MFLFKKKEKNRFLRKKLDFFTKKRILFKVHHVICIIKMVRKDNTSLYVSIPSELDQWIDMFRLQKIKENKTQYSKTQIIKLLIENGRDIELGKYLKLDPNIDDFVSKLRNITIEKDGEKMTYKKSKDQVYFMLIEKGLEHLNEQ